MLVSIHINLPLVTLDVWFSDESDSEKLEVKSIKNYKHCLTFDPVTYLY